MLTADGEAGDTPLRFFTQNTMPLWRLGLFSHNLWDTCGDHSPFFNQHSSSEDVFYLKKDTRFPAWKTWWILRLRENYLPCHFRLMKRSTRTANGKRCFAICFTRIFQVSGWFTSRVYIQLKSFQTANLQS